MSKLGITTGSNPNDGTGDTLLQGAVKINSNFDEVYTFLGNGSALTTIANSKLTNSSVSFGGVSVTLGSSDATPAFDLTDATNYPTSSLTGTITNAQLAGSIADGKLSSTFLKLNDNSTGNVNLAGIITAQQGVRVNADSGNSTAASATNYFSVGAGEDLKIYHNGGTNYVIAPNGTLQLRADNFQLVSDDSAGRAIFLDNSNSLLELGFDGVNSVHVKGTEVKFLKPITASADSTHDIGTNSVRFRNAYVDTLYGDGSSLTGIVTSIVAGSNITLTGGPTGIVTISSSGGGGGGISNVVDDTTPQLGGNLDLNSKNITGTGNIDITGNGTFDGTLNLNTGSTNVLSLAADNSQNSVITQLGSGNFTLKTATASNSSMTIWADGSAGQITLKTGTGVGVVNRLYTTSTGVHINNDIKCERIFLSSSNPYIQFEDISGSTDIDGSYVKYTSSNGLGGQLSFNVQSASDGLMSFLGNGDRLIVINWEDPINDSYLGIGNVTSSVSSPNIALYGSGSATFAGTLTATSFSGNGNDIVHSTWTLGANGSSHYTFTGPGGLSATDDPIIYLARGQTYEFVNNSGGSHPFQIRVSNGGSAYSTGVTNNGASSGTIKFEVPFSAPNTLYYQCTAHSGMGNNIVVYPSV